jgi:hypothetical protein
MDLKERKRLALEMEKKQDKENKRKAIEAEKAEEAGGGDAPAGSAERITKILKMLEEEIVARSNKDSEPQVEAEKPCGDGMTELKKYFSGKEGLRRSNIFLKFAKLLTDGGDGASESIAQVPQAPQVVAETKHAPPAPAPSD